MTIRRKQLQIWGIVLVCIALVFLLSFWVGSGWNLLALPGMVPLKLERTASRGEVPDFSGEITEVRITAVERSYHLTPLDGTFYKTLRDCQAIQIYYGYKMDGVWYDYPCENYKMLSRFGWEGSSYEYANNIHWARIGNYLLFCSTLEDDTNHKLWDTLGTEVTNPFSQYCEEYMGLDHPYRYAYYRENPESLRPLHTLDCEFTFPFRDRTYIIIPLDEVTADYELYFTFASGDEVFTNSWTGAEILELASFF